MVSMEQISHGAILETLRKRYSRDEIYTNVSDIVIAVNPFQTLNIYTSEYVDKYAKAADTTDLEPHIYSIGANAMQGLFDFGKSQAVSYEVAFFGGPYGTLLLRIIISVCYM